MKRAVCLTVRRLDHQVQWANAFKEGLNKHGEWQIEMTDNQGMVRPGANLYICWSVRHVPFIQSAKRAGAEIIILERGYIGDRYEWTSISFGGGLNGRATFRGPFTDASRWNKFFADAMQPWKTDNNGYGLILGQVQGDMAMKNVNPQRFYEKARVHFTRMGITPKFRPHPHILPKHGKPALRQSVASLAKDLAGSQIAVSWNSSAGVAAILAGVPHIAMDQGSMAYDVSGHEWSKPPMPDRSAWAHALAWKQWTIDEVQSGYCWDNIKGDL